jgi:methionyl-tRNA formyltransferase
MDKKYFVQIIGVRAHLFKDYICRLGCKVEIISKPDEISNKADICLACGVYYILKSKYLIIPRLGIWGFHESPLPKGRGSAPIHWTVLENSNTLTVSFFELVQKMDAGNLLGQMNCSIQKTDLLEDLRVLACNLTKKLLDKYLIGFLSGEIVSYEQKGIATYYPRRKSQDSKLDISKTFEELWDLIRVCNNEEYSAWFEINGKKFILKRYNDQKVIL